MSLNSADLHRSFDDFHAPRNPAGRLFHRADIPVKQERVSYDIKKTAGRLQLVLRRKLLAVLFIIAYFF